MIKIRRKLTPITGFTNMERRRRTGFTSMVRRRRKLILATGFLLVLSNYIYEMELSLFRYIERSVDSVPYIVNTPTCKIPNFHSYQLRNEKFVQTVRPASYAPLVYRSGYHLTVDLKAAGLLPYNSFEFCTYKPIHRPNILPIQKNYIWYGPESAPFKTSIEVTHEFVHVNCFDKQNNSIYSNVYAFIQSDTNVDEMFRNRLEKHMKEKSLKKYLNVMLVGIDSLSRSSFIHQTVKTREFLQDKLAAFNMMGYSKVADNTYVDIVPLALGQFIEEIPGYKNKLFDEFGFIWKQYATKGYRTLFAEDRSDISTFDNMKRGFYFPPCEHYYRPAREEGYCVNSNDTCFQDQLESEIVLNYTYDFVDTYRNTAHFSLTFLTGTTDNQHDGSQIDDIYYNFFKRLHDSDLIRDTVVVFPSDHGLRNNSARESYTEKLEKRLPLMYVIVPQWLRDSYPNVLNALRINQNRLATPFDIYETLKDILFFDGLTKPARSTGGVSWFQEIPYNRSCESAGISLQWCACQQNNITTTVGVDGKYVM